MRACLLWANRGGRHFDPRLSPFWSGLNTRLVNTRFYFGGSLGVSLKSKRSTSRPSPDRGLLNEWPGRAVARGVVLVVRVHRPAATWHAWGRGGGGERRVGTTSGRAWGNENAGWGTEAYREHKPNPWWGSGSPKQANKRITFTKSVAAEHSFINKNLNARGYFFGVLFGILAFLAFKMVIMRFRAAEF